MDEPTPRFQELFFAVYEALPRQGPGDLASARKALDLCRDLPPGPTILDLGCGVGGQTLHLATLTTGVITAVDSHAPSIKRLAAIVAELGLGRRIQPLVGDMVELQLPPTHFDLIWSEGALYNIGIDHALRYYHSLLRPGGYFVFTDAVWRKDDPPPSIMAGFKQDYPTMGGVTDLLAIIATTEYELIDHFPLPDEAWWTDFYTPMERRINELRPSYRADAEAVALLDQLAMEPELHRRYSDYYAYEFFVLRRR